MTATRLLLFGPPGVGKGTQAASLEQKRGLVQVSTGEMFRAALASGSELGELARGYMDRGELVPDSVVIGVAEERLRQPDVKRGFILDGFPRTPAQAQALDELLARLDLSLERCLVLVVEEDRLVERLLKRAELEGRSDDTEETIRNRMRVYRTQTEPLIAYYRDKGLVVEIDGVGTIEAVAKRVERAIDS